MCAKFREMQISSKKVSDELFFAMKYEANTKFGWTTDERKIL